MSEKKKIPVEVLRERKLKYRKSHKLVGLNYSFEKLQEIKKAAAKRKMKAPQYMKAVIENSLTHTGYIVPDDVQLQKLVLSIRAISNNINQLVRYTHERRDVTQKDIEYLQKQLLSLEQSIIQALAHPPELIAFLSDYLLKNPEKKAGLIACISQSNDH